MNDNELPVRFADNSLFLQEIFKGSHAFLGNRVLILFAAVLISAVACHGLNIKGIGFIRLLTTGAALFIMLSAYITSPAQD